MPLFGPAKEQTQPRSPIEQILSSFTDQSVRMHAILGFPGVLLLIAILFAVLPAMVPGLNPSTAFTILAITALGGSVVTYLAEWYVSLRRAEAQAEIVSGYTKLFVEKYFDSLTEKVSAENVLFAIDHILMPLLKKRQPALPGKTDNAE